MRRMQRGIKRNFNPRPRKEGDIMYIGITDYVFYFNPRPRKEGDVMRSCS